MDTAGRTVVAFVSVIVTFFFVFWIGGALLLGLRTESAGADAVLLLYRELPGIGRNAQDPAYDREDLFIWLFKPKRR